MASAAKLYTGEMLALATSLAEYAWDEALPHQGRARSPSCGSTLRLGLATDAAGRIARVGILAQACAVGQASAAIFAAAAAGRTRADIAGHARALGAWLGGQGAMPDWPGLTAIAPARAYPARHGAIMLAWTAALDAFSTIALPG